MLQNTTKNKQDKLSRFGCNDPNCLPDISDKMFDILKGIHYCKTRQTPDGSNIAWKIQGTLVMIDKLVWYMFVNSSDDGERIKEIICQIVELFQNPVYQTMYHTTLKQVIKNNTLLTEATNGNTYWKDLTGAVDTVNIVNLNYLCEVFLDEEIEIIMNSAFQSEAVPSFTTSMYTDDMKSVAFGK